MTFKIRSNNSTKELQSTADRFIPKRLVTHLRSWDQDTFDIQTAKGNVDHYNAAPPINMIAENQHITVGDTVFMPVYNTTEQKQYVMFARVVFIDDFSNSYHLETIEAVAASLLEYGLEIESRVKSLEERVSQLLRGGSVNLISRFLVPHDWGCARWPEYSKEKPTGRPVGFSKSIQPEICCGSTHISEYQTLQRSMYLGDSQLPMMSQESPLVAVGGILIPMSLMKMTFSWLQRTLRGKSGIAVGNLQEYGRKVGLNCNRLTIGGAV